jgi:NADPH2:quinone reductase
MKAILMTATGSPDVLSIQEIPEPQIQTDSQVKIKLLAAGINPVDTKIRRHGLFYNNPLPAVLGCDGVGEIIATGTAVKHFKIGDKVWFCHGGLGQEQGNYAEFNVIDERWLSHVPTNTSIIEAAAAPLVLITAWGALFERGGLQAGQTVVVHAGAGGVGHVAIQLAKLKGARVITTVSSLEKADFVKSLGADEVVFYNQQNVTEAINELTDQKGANLIFDTVGSEVFKASIPATAHFGRLITLLDPGEVSLVEARMRNLLIGFELMLTPMLRNLNEARDKHVSLLNECAKLIDQGMLKVHVDQYLPLEQAAQAHTTLEQGHTTGKLVLTM